jgi:hypothetical protein
LLEPGLVKTLDAAEAALLEVTLGGAFRCESADPAADLEDLLDESLRSTFDAAVAARFDVTSELFAI